MADYRPDWDSETIYVAREYLGKYPTELTGKELEFVRKFIAMDKRLKKVDAFLWSLK